LWSLSARNSQPNYMQNVANRVSLSIRRLLELSYPGETGGPLDSIGRDAFPTASYPGPLDYRDRKI